MQDKDQFELFSGNGLSSYLASKLQSAQGLAAGLTQQQCLTTDRVELVGQIMDQLTIAPLVLHMDQMQPAHSDVKINKMVEASDYGRRYWREEMVRGNKMSYAIPFTGTPMLWHLNHGPSLMRPGTVDVGQSVLTVSLQNTADVGSAWYQKTMEETMKTIDRHLEVQHATLTQYHTKLATTVESAVAKRQQEFKT